ncbi:MAG: RagB/SusD family nutrient uptake outer membrane protein [Bacteroidales bacterium]|nr:RagB/SusD family nutrient uptake outer membrane protein [Bacteroidales bacterium]
MKIRNIYLSLIVLALVMSACSDFLEVQSKTDKDSGNYYQTSGDANEALTGCYDVLQLIWSGGVALPVATEIMSDLCFGSTGAGDDEKYPMIDEFDKEVSAGNNSIYEDNWKAYYEGIYRCNMLIKNIDKIDFDDDEQKRQVEGEVHFLRAFFYFDMVRMWERIPLLTEPSRENIPQSSPDETYQLIAADLQIAIDNCRNVKYSEMEPTWYGHASIWAAKSMMARVYLYYTGYYGKTSLFDVTKSDALAHLEDVIAESGHDLLPDNEYHRLWPAAATYKAVADGGTLLDADYAGETNQEVLFSIKYTFTSDYDGNTDGNHWMVMQGLRGINDTKYGYGEGWGSSTVLPEFYTSWDDNDQRKMASVMAIDEEGVNFSSTEIKGVKEYTGYFTKKYIPQCDVDGNSVTVGVGGLNLMIGQYQDFFVIRYADVLLMAAELGSTNALDYVNKIRNRAGLVNTASVDKDVIYQERKYEFAFEGLWYWDLLRYDNTLQYAADAVSFSGTVLDGGVEKEKTIDGANLLNTRGLFQIPRGQITLSAGTLEQNAGW